MDRHGLALSEVHRNLMSSPVRSLVLMLMFLAIGVGVSAFTRGDTDRIAAVAATQYRAGAFVYELVGPSGARVDALKCNSLNGVDGVVAAGGVMASSVVALESQPEAQLRLLTVTPSFIGAAWPGVSSANRLSVFAGNSLKDLGIAPDSRVRYQTTQGESYVLHVDAVAHDPSVTGEERLLVEVAPPSGTLDSCLVLVAPPATHAAGEAFSGFFGAGTTVRAVLLSSDLIADPKALFASRLSGLGWLAAGLACAIILVGSWLARRHEFALYRLMGFTEPAVFVMLCAEAALVCFVPAQLGLMIGVGGHGLDPLTAQALFVDVARLDAVMLALPAIGYLFLPRGSLLPALLGK